MMDLFYEISIRPSGNPIFSPAIKKQRPSAEQDLQKTAVR